MKKFLGLAVAGGLAVILAACGGGGPLLTTHYAGVGTVLGERCAYAVGVVTTRSGSASNAESLARQTCERTATTAAAGAARSSCRVDAGTECAAVAVGINSSRMCGIFTEGSGSLGNAQSSALRDCRSELGSTANCEVLVSGCPSGSPSTSVWRPSTPSPSPSPSPTPSPSPSPQPGNMLPSEPTRTTAPQASGSDWSGVEVAGAGGTAYVSALNRRSGTIRFQAGTWFEPKDGKYQRMIITQSTSVPPGQVVRIPTACMQAGNPAPANGARFFSNPKQTSGSIQQCQARCLSGGQSVQSCVWGCENQPNEIVFRTDDRCNDGRSVDMRFAYAQSSSSGAQFVNWATGVLVAGGVDTVTRVSCNVSGADTVCYGARIDGTNRYFGQDVDGTQRCTDCCYRCPDSGRRVVDLPFGC